MSSAFEWVAKNVVQELSKDGELIPVDSLKSSSCFSPYSLLRKKTKSSLFWRSHYGCLNLTLKDILDPSSPEPEVTQHGPFLFNDKVNGQVSTSVEATTSVQGKNSGQTLESNRTALEVKTLTVLPNTWDCLQKERKLKTPEPSLLEELRKRGENLYVVVEAVKTQKETILKSSRKKGQGGWNIVKTVTVPEGSILAFQVAKLIIQDHWEVLLLPDKKQKTFAPKVADEDFSNVCDDALIRPSCSMGTYSENHQKDPKNKGGGSRVGFQVDAGSDLNTVLGFEQLKAEVENEQRPLTMQQQQDRKQQQSLLQALLGLLQSERDLLYLEDMHHSILLHLYTHIQQFLQPFLHQIQLESYLHKDIQKSVLHGVEGKILNGRTWAYAPSPGSKGLPQLEQSLFTGEPPQKVEGITGNILRKLQDQNGQLVEELAGAILYLIGALNALSDIQHQLLIQLLQKKEKILSQEIDLVKGILKENFNQMEERPFSLPLELLSFVQGQDENLTLAFGLLEECGLQISGDEPQFTWNPSALQSLCALYGSLVMLQTLTDV
ncbi:gasdermin-D-like isoform X1 [Petaurus breviceps papuanus]|uniref:gasdermin-D-like isoform X1 n=1 Tax=Petaurus breviceps papuanus TaxID=3040969 RepID=UPI0036DF4138